MDELQDNMVSSSDLMFVMKPFLKAFIFFFPILVSTHVMAGNAATGDRFYKAGNYQQAMMYYMKTDAQQKPEIMNRIGFMYDEGQV